MNKYIENLKQTKKSSIAVYLVLRGLVILCMILQILRGDWNNAFLCLLSLVLFTVPGFIEAKLKIELPDLLEIIIYLFIFSAEILGEINNFYAMIPYWDTILHTLNGFLAAGIGFALVEILNENSKNINLSPLFIAIVAFSFSMTIGVLWEFIEYGMDKNFYYDMQKDKVITSISSVTFDETRSNKSVTVGDIEKTEIYSKNSDGTTTVTTIDGGYLDIGLNDTMKDLLVNFVGAVTFSILGGIYITNKSKFSFVTNFIPTKLKET